jgi:hypothetical protein
MYGVDNDKTGEPPGEQRILQNLVRHLLESSRLYGATDCGSSSVRLDCRAR